MKTIENKKGVFILGVSGKRVECMLLDSMGEIKISNPHLTDEEIEAVYSLLSAEIAGIKEQMEMEDSQYIDQ